MKLMTPRCHFSSGRLLRFSDILAHFSEAPFNYVRLATSLLLRKSWSPPSLGQSIWSSCQVQGSIETFKFVDETHRRDLTAALELTVAGSTQRDCVAEVPVVQAESAAAAQARRQAAEFMRAEKARESQSRDVREVERAPGKRRATRPVLN